MKSKILGLLAAGLLLTTATANAAIITYDFTVNGGSEGPFANVVASGFFSYDDIIVPAGGGNVTGGGWFTAFGFSWAGVAYNLTNTQTARLDFNASGDLTGARFGNNCSGFTCSFGAPGDWAINTGSFAYNVGDVIYRGFVTPLSRRTESVPEPTTLALLGLGLLGMGMRRRIKAS